MLGHRHTHSRSTSGSTLPFVYSVDSLGIFASTLCLIHCLALPLLLLAMPAIGGRWLHSDCTHYVLAFFVTAFCLLGIVPGYLRHSQKLVLFMMAGGLSLVLFATFACTLLLGERWEVPFITLGNLLVVSAHMRNRSLLTCTH
jgi:hypothetical protein